MHHQFGHVPGGALGIDLALGVQRRHVAAAHHDDPVTARIIGFFPGVDHVVQVARGEVEPANAVRSAQARNHAKPGVHLWVKLNLVAPQGHGLVVMEQWQVVQH